MKFKLINNVICENDVDGVLLSSMDNRYWFTSFLSSAGYLFINKNNQAILLIDGRYYEKAKELLSSNIKVLLLKPNSEILLTKQIENILNELSIKKLAIESEYTTVKDYQFYLQWNVELFPFDSYKLRAIKTEQELEYLQTAANIAANTIEWIKTQIKPGMSELDVAKMISIHMLELGAEKNSFDPIVASGINSANPHHHPTDKIIEIGEIITIDIGCIYKGYCSDITRTFILGSKPLNSEWVDIYNVVLEAQLAGINMASNKISGKNLDMVCRNIIDNSKYKNYFCHTTGHGVGIQVHEEPYVSFSNDNLLVNNNVVTIEPGIYVPNVGGIRIEDTIVIKNDKAIVLTKNASKELYVKI